MADDVEALYCRRRRVRRVRARAAATAAVVVIGGAGLAVGLGQETLPTGEERTAQEPSKSPEPTPDAITATGPSQTAQDARRDGVLPEVAALSFPERVRILAVEPTGEGLWAITRLPGSPGVLGDPRGRYGLDWVQRHEYGELLLLDATGARILRAVPLPGVPAQTLLVHDDAVYCARQGDGGLPDSMLCRVDRDGPGTLVRVFAGSSPAPSRTVDRPGWERQPAPAQPIFSSIGPCPQGLCVHGSDVTVPFHPKTLRLPYDRALAPDTAQACRHVRTAYEAIERVPEPAARKGDRSPNSPCQHVNHR